MAISEVQLPPISEGQLLVVGRSDSGLEMATVLDTTRPDTWEDVINAFVEALKDMGSDGKIWMQ